MVDQWVSLEVSALAARPRAKATLALARAPKARIQKIFFILLP
jgi:hypothetical protein